MSDALRVGIVGCGVIARQYAERMRAYPQVALAAVTDAEPERARSLGEQHDVPALGFDELLDAVEAVLVLTPPATHASLVARALDVGRHVFSEKPLAMTAVGCRELIARASSRGLRLASAPVTYMGESQQTAWKLIRDGACGDVQLVYADLNYGALERWHPAPQPFFAIGPLYDIGVYPLTIATAFFGPAVRARALGRVLASERTALDGTRFEVTTPDWVLGIVELASGVVVRLTVSLGVENSRQNGLEFHGQAGSVYLGSHQFFGSEVSRAPAGATGFEPVPLVREPAEGIDWGAGIADLADAIRDDRPHRASAEHAAHVVEIMEALMRSAAADGAPHPIGSTFAPPPPQEWAL